MNTNCFELLNIEYPPTGKVDGIMLMVNFISSVSNAGRSLGIGGGNAPKVNIDKVRSITDKPFINIMVPIRAFILHCWPGD